MKRTAFWAFAIFSGLFLLLSGFILLQEKVSGQAYKSAFAALESYQSQHPEEHPRFLAVVDYSKPSFLKRMAVIDLKNGEQTFYLTAHGLHSGDLYATRFSNDRRPLYQAVSFAGRGPPQQDSRIGHEASGSRKQGCLAIEKPHQGVAGIGSRASVGERLLKPADCGLQQRHCKLQDQARRLPGGAQEKVRPDGRRPGHTPEKLSIPAELQQAKRSMRGDAGAPDNQR